MFEKSGQLNLNVLTALLTQSLEETAQKITLYRQALARSGHDPKAGRVTLMLHTFVTNDAHEARKKVEGPLTRYLKSHLEFSQNNDQKSGHQAGWHRSRRSGKS